MTEFYPSKWGHTLDDAEITFMLEPYPGTQSSMSTSVTAHQ